MLVVAFTMLICSQVQAQRASWGDSDAEVGTLDLSATSGTAPFNLTLRGPANFVKVVSEYKGGRGMGCPYFINWGDGKTDPAWEMDTDKKLRLSHTYNVPGIYAVRASLIKWHPNDSTSATWTATSSIKVTSTVAVKPSLTVIQPKGGEVFAYQEFPDLVLNLLTNTRNDLIMELIDQDNKVLGRDEMRDFSYSDPKYTHGFRPPEFTDVDKALRLHGKVKCRIRLQLKSTSGALLASAITPEFVITSEYPKSLTKLHDANVDVFEDGLPVSSGHGGRVVPAVAKSKNSLEITLRYIARFKHGFSYSIDWGDGSKPLVKDKPPGKNAGLMEEDYVYFKHVYPKAGRYTIKMRSTDHEPLEPLSKRFEYEQVVVNPGGAK